MKSLLEYILFLIFENEWHFLCTSINKPTLFLLQDMPVSQYLTEDIYIDDEFGSRLNYNLVLLDDEIHLLNTALSDNESLPQTTEL